MMRNSEALELAPAKVGAAGSDRREGNVGIWPMRRPQPVRHHRAAFWTRPGAHGKLSHQNNTMTKLDSQRLIPKSKMNAGSHRANMSEGRHRRKEDGAMFHFKRGTSG